MSAQLFEEEATRANTARNGRPPHLPEAEAPEAVPGEAAIEVPAAAPINAPRTLSGDRASLTHAFSVEGVEGLAIVGLFEDGKPGEVLLVLRQADPGVAAALETWTGALALSLSYDVPAGPLAASLAPLAPEGAARAVARHLSEYLQGRFPA